LQLGVFFPFFYENFKFLIFVYQIYSNKIQSTGKEGKDCHHRKKHFSLLTHCFQIII